MCWFNPYSGIAVRSGCIDCTVDATLEGLTECDARPESSGNNDRGVRRVYFEDVDEFFGTWDRCRRNMSFPCRTRLTCGAFKSSVATVPATESPRARQTVLVGKTRQSAGNGEVFSLATATSKARVNIAIVSVLPIVAVPKVARRLLTTATLLLPAKTMPSHSRLPVQGDVQRDGRVRERSNADPLDPGTGD